MKININDLVSAEEARLRKVFADLPKIKNELADGVFYQMAFARVQQEILAKEICKKGSVEKFTQSPDVKPYERERPAVKQWTTYNKQYMQMFKQLSDLLPAGAEVSTDSIGSFNEEYV